MPFSEHHDMTRIDESNSYLISVDFPDSLPVGKQPLTQETIQEMIELKLKPTGLNIQKVEDHGSGVWIYCRKSTGDTSGQNTIQDHFTQFEPKSSGATLIIEVNKNSGNLFVCPTFY